jgi:hypothetical protein
MLLRAALRQRFVVVGNLNSPQVADGRIPVWPPLPWRLLPAPDGRPGRGELVPIHNLWRILWKPRLTREATR